MSSTNSVTVGTSATIERAISLLGSGLGAEVVASTLGVSASYISQLLSQEDIATKVTTLRYEALQKHNVRDLGYDALEDKLLEKMDDLLPLMQRPMEVVKALSVVNAAKRRGQSAPESVTQQQTVVQLVLPTQVVNQFQVDVKNTVIKTGDRELLTINPKQLLASSVKGSTNEQLGFEERSREKEATRVGTN